MGRVSKKTPESMVKDIRKNTRRLFTSEQKVLIVMEGLRAELSVSELCRKYSITQAQFYKWNKEFLEAGKKRLSGDITRKATSDGISELRKENAKLKEVVADLVLRYDILKNLRHAGINELYHKYMRLTAVEKYELIQTVTTSELGVKKTLEEFGIAKSSFYKWYKRYLEKGYDGLEKSK
ncbi:transposase [Myroides odoratimimus]|uniref:transposase n=1 Tax=Myroides odoratimimus TaxID=76832 RepID=UPI002DBC10E9|nr:transposase [Myroides odoratimimus]MEC4053475.1 transposase [Myroides odoratimimus]